MRLTLTVKPVDALTSACSAGATNLEVAVAALASIWGTMASPAKVSMLVLCSFLIPLTVKTPIYISSTVVIF